MIPSFFRRLGTKGESPGSTPQKVHKGGIGIAVPSQSLAHASPSKAQSKRQRESQPLPHGRDPGRCTAPSERPTNTPDPAAACVERNRSNSDARSATSRMATQENSCAVASVHLTGDSLKEAVVLRCLRSTSPGRHLAQKRKELIEKYASLKVNDVSIELSSVHQKQENLLKDAMARAIADTLCLLVAADDKKSQMYPAGPSCQAASAAHTCEALLNASDNEKFSSDHSHTSNTSVSSRKNHLNIQSALGSCQSPASIPQPSVHRVPHTDVRAGTPNKAATPKVLRVEDYQCFFCGLKGSKHLVRLRGGHHAQGKSSATLIVIALIPRIPLRLPCEGLRLGGLWQHAPRLLHVSKDLSTVNVYSGPTRHRSSKR